MSNKFSLRLLSLMFSLTLLMFGYQVAHAQTSPVLCALEWEEGNPFCEVSEWSTNLSRGLYEVIAHSHNSGPDDEECSMIYVNGELKGTICTNKGTDRIQILVDDDNASLKVVHTPDTEVQGLGSMKVEVKDISEPGYCQKNTIKTINYADGTITGNGWGGPTGVWRLIDLTTETVIKEGSGGVAVYTINTLLKHEYQLQFQGHDGDWSTQDCKFSMPPAQASLTAQASCSTASFELKTEDPGQLTYNFKATASDGTVIEWSEAIDVSSGTTTDNKAWELTKFGEYTLRYYATFNGKFGSFAKVPPTELKLVCNLPAQPTISASATCTQQPLISGFAGEAGLVRYEFRALQNGTVINESVGELRVEAGDYQITDLNWGNLDQLGEYTLSHKVTFTGDFDSTAESNNPGTTLTCNQPGQTTIQVQASCTQNPHIILTAGEPGHVTYTFEVFDANGNLVDNITGAGDYPQGTHDINLPWNITFPDITPYTFKYMVIFAGIISEPKVDGGTITDTCNQPLGQLALSGSCSQLVIGYTGVNAPGILRVHGSVPLGNIDQTYPMPAGEGSQTINWTVPETGLYGIDLTVDLVINGQIVATQKFVDPNCGTPNIPEPEPEIGTCSFGAEHRGDPWAYINRFSVWIEGNQESREIEFIKFTFYEGRDDDLQFIAERNLKFDEYPGGLFTSIQYDFPYPDVHFDFGDYTFKAEVKIKGIEGSILCQDGGFAQDHDNLLFNLGPFAKNHEKAQAYIPQGKGDLPAVTQAAMCEDTTKCSMNIYKIEYLIDESGPYLGNYTDGGIPDKVGISDLEDFRKGDGYSTNSCIGMQQKQTGVIYSLTCMAPDGKPQDQIPQLFVGGMSSIADPASEKMSWRFNQQLASEGWIVRDRSVATCLALMGDIVTPEGKLVPRFSPNQDQETGELANIKSVILPGMRGTHIEGENFPFEKWPQYMKDSCNPDGSLR